MTDHPVPDYDLDDQLHLQDPAQYRALFEATRTRIVTLLSERAATTSELSDVLDKPKGTVGHHLKVLEEAGLVHVVRTEKVRALTAKYYGRTARTFFYDHVGEAIGEPQRVLSAAATEIAQAPEGTFSANRRYARIPEERAREWHRRLDELLLEFEREPRDGDSTYALVYGIYAVEGRALPKETP